MSLEGGIAAFLACLAVSEVRGWLGPAYYPSRGQMDDVWFLRSC